MKFKTDKSIDDWVENHRAQGCTSNASAGEQFIYEFIPTSIMEVQTVKCMCCGDNLHIMMTKKGDYN